MDPARWRLLKQIFQEALERPDGERRAFVAGSVEDPTLRAEVEALLAAHGQSGAFLISPTGESADDTEPAALTFERLQRALLGRYSLERELGRGGMAIVYLARDVALDRLVAVKLLPPGLASNPGYRDRFLREARTAAGLSHPNIVPIHLVEENDGLVYFVMAFIDGESLGQRVRRAGPLRSSEVARLVQEVSWALAHAHGRGVIHRDIKPDNLLIDQSGRALVTDFGIARVAAAASEADRGQVLGTRAYMSPEQASTDTPIDGRADLYSLGVTAFFALTGRLPFESAHPPSVTAMHLSEPAPPVRSVAATVPARLAEAVDRCLAKDPAGRFPNGEALAEAIAGAQLTRREVAPSVREFLATAKSGAAQTTMLALMWMGLGVSGLADAGVGGTILVGMLLSMTPLVLIHPLLAARGVIRAGLDHDDVAEAVGSASETLDANIEYEVARATYLGEKFSSLWARGVFLAAAVPLFFLFPRAFIEMIRAGGTLEGLGILIYLSVLTGAEVFFLGMAIVPKKAAATLTRGTPENAGFLRKLWQGPIGRWLFKLAGIGMKRAKPLPARDSAPTEVVLGRAAIQLFDQLPDHQRARLGDVRGVIQSLERAASSLRDQRDALDQALGEAGPPDGSPRRSELVAELEAARGVVEQRLGLAVAALENLRLDLLRLRAGVGSPDGLTASIEEARSVGAAVELEVAARREVESSTRR